MKRLRARKMERSDWDGMDMQDKNASRLGGLSKERDELFIGEVA